MHETLICPKHLHYDKIEKVSYILKSQTRTRENTTWVTETYKDEHGKERSFSYPRVYEVVEITDLAKRLLPPTEPKAKGSGCLILFGLLFILTGGVLLFGGLLMGIIGGMGAFLEESASANFILGVIVLGIALVASLPMIGIGLAMLRTAADNDKREKERIAREKLLWQDAMKKWDQLYYCAQDDIVFIRGMSTWVSSEKMDDLLYARENAA